jgi:hypothetical protein
MTQNLDPLILDFLEWIGPVGRPYSEVMEAWRTSCPRLTVFEDSIDRGFVARSANGGERTIALTETGRHFLAERRMAPWKPAPSREETRAEDRRR